MNIDKLGVDELESNQIISQGGAMNEAGFPHNESEVSQERELKVDHEKIQRMFDKTAAFFEKVREMDPKMIFHSSMSNNDMLLLSGNQEIVIYDKHPERPSKDSTLTEFTLLAIVDHREGKGDENIHLHAWMNPNNPKQNQYYVSRGNGARHVSLGFSESDKNVDNYGREAVAWDIFDHENSQTKQQLVDTIVNTFSTMIADKLGDVEHRYGERAQKEKALEYWKQMLTEFDKKGLPDKVIEAQSGIQVCQALLDEMNTVRNS